MAIASGYLIDTNILLRSVRVDDPEHGLIRRALFELDRKGAPFYVAMQNLAEFWNVSTRPVVRNGYGLSIEETSYRLHALEATMKVLPDHEQTYPLWRQMVVEYRIQGVQVHDARLAAIMQAHGVRRILTLNTSDFLRYSAIEAVHPAQV